MLLAALWLCIKRYLIFIWCLDFCQKAFSKMYQAICQTHGKHIGHTAKRTSVSATFLYQGKFAVIIGQPIPSSSNSFMPKTLFDSFI